MRGPYDLERHCSLREVAEVLNVSIERVRQIEARALAKLRRMLREAGIEESEVER